MSQPSPLSPPRPIPSLAALASVFFLALIPASGQAPPEVQALWDKLSAKWSDSDLAGAETAADALVAALEPSAADFSLGVQLNSALHNRASLRYNLGDFAGAEADLLRSVAQAKDIGLPAGLPPQAAPQMQAMVDDRVRLSLRGLVNFYLAAGDLERATKAFDEATAILPLWKRQADDNPALGYQVLASEVSSMEGAFHRAAGDYAKAAEAVVTRLEEIDGAWEKVLALHGGNESDFTDQLKMNYLRGRSHLLMELAELASLQTLHDDAVGYCDEARASALAMMPLYRKWAETTLRTNPAMPPETVQKTLEGVEISTDYLVHERIALVLRAAGRERAALDLMLEGLGKRDEDFAPQRFLTLEYNIIRPEESLKLVGDLRAILGEHGEAEAAYAKALDAISRAYPAGHPASLEIGESRALLARARGDMETARRLADEIIALRLRNLADVLAFADEAMRLSYRASVDPSALHASLGLADELAEIVLRTKGIVLESLLEDRGLASRTNDPELEAALAEMQSLRRRLMESILGGEETKSAELRRRFAELEDRIRAGAGQDGPSRPRAREAVSVTLAEAAAALPEGGALVEFLRYRDYDAPGRFRSRYGAVVIRADVAPVFVPLDPAAAVEEALATYALAVREELPDDEMRALLASIGRRVWEPLLPHLPEPGSPLIISPDGELNFLSFAALLAPDGRFVGEAWPILYVSSGRDLLRRERPAREKSFEILANPDFQTPTTATLAARRDLGGAAAVAMRGVLGRIGLSPLPGTAAEAEALVELVGREWGWRVGQHLGNHATEAAAGSVQSPGILHLATHGVYLPRTGRADPLERARGYWLDAEGAAAPLERFSDVVLDNPMFRGGIALAGAAATLREWGEGRILETDNDGLLTAAEMAGLSLRGTWLVVLSACETGLGEARAGEGVLGMRRGLAEAGAEHLLLTLWPVADEETALFMVGLYEGLAAGDADPVETFPAVQADFLRRFREERGLAAAVRLAGPFVLSRGR